VLTKAQIVVHSNRHLKTQHPNSTEKAQQREKEEKKIVAFRELIEKRREENEK